MREELEKLLRRYKEDVERLEKEVWYCEEYYRNRGKISILEDVISDLETLLNEDYRNRRKTSILEEVISDLETLLNEL